MSRTTRKIVNTLISPLGLRAAPISKFHDLTRENNSFLHYLARHSSHLPLIRESNRQALASVPSWISQEVLEKSHKKYGIPEDISDIDPIEENLTYTDILLFLSSFLTHPINYLEIGVSLGQNFFQVMNYFENATLTGLDIEKIYPILEEQLEKTTSESPSPIQTYRFPSRSNTVRYLEADLYRDDTWPLLQGTPYNIIFSDASHHPEAIKREFHFIQKLGLLDQKEFVILWDDLQANLSEAFAEIAMELMDIHGLDRRSVGHLHLSGSWNNAQPHLIGYVIKTNG